MEDAPVAPTEVRPLDTDITDAPELFEQLTDDEAREAYQAGQMERFGAWHGRQQEIAAEDPTGIRGITLEIRLANIQVAAGEQEAAAERLQEVYSNVWQMLRAHRGRTGATGAEELQRLTTLEHLMVAKKGLKIRFAQLTGLELEDDDEPSAPPQG